MNEVRKQENETNVDIPERFKMTDLGLLPEEWEVTHFENVVEEIISGDWGHDKPAHGLLPCRVLRGTDFVHAAGNDISKVPIRYVRFSSVERRRLRVGDILVELSGGSKDQPTGRTLLVTDSLLRISDLLLLFSNFVKCIRLSSRCIPEYITFYWHYLYESGVTRIYEKRTTGIRNFKLSDFLANEMLPLPPLPEQRAIAHVLRTVQRAKEATERVIQATRELKKSLMCYLFTYGPVPVEEAEKVPLKETEIGLVPEHWEVVRLGEVVQKVDQLDPRKNPEWRFRYIDVSSIDNQRLCITGYQEYLGQDAPSRARKPVKTGDVIFATVRPYLKRVALVPSEFDGQICSTAFCVLRANNHKITSEYLFFAVSHDRFVHSVSEHQRGSSYPAVTDGDVLRELIPLPPLPEQRKIACILRTVDKKLQAEETRKQDLEALFKTLLHNLMTGKIRVKDLGLSETGEVV